MDSKSLTPRKKTSAKNMPYHLTVIWPIEISSGETFHTILFSSDEIY